MDIVKLSQKSGQISVPKEYRNQHPEVLFFEVEIIDNELKYKPFIKDNDIRNINKKGKYTLEDLKKVQFSSKNKKERNLVNKIDQILYGA
ncbi:hypothetical protein A2335_04470 [Candidatus Peregrinibacteria bacterium RIFOXYB2_FULL_32_7]|nr:MAG: hypothetical protein A2335_04470 [Candidatus Peregrinibacteria bacterium RIFOXYB2_FULL_32_7]